MNKKQIKGILKEEFYNILTEDINYDFNFKGKKMKLRFDVNSNPTKKGIKIQFTPNENLSLHPNEARQFMTDLQIYINQKLASKGMTVDFDPDVPYQNVIGFTLKLGVIANVISKTLGGIINEPQNQDSDEKQTHKFN